ncbi:MAG: DUF1848 domain-containing protein [Tannerella sp.]|jgi:DNA repair photolyase|nr:DUF1848 domain-containing protein [Tannerella sp.]
MIISASRRTDIPAFYSQWFINRIKEGFVYVPNPFNPNMISRVSLHPSLVDGIVFWTKNPKPMIDKLNCLQDYKYYFQFTLNPYGDEIEINLPSVRQRIDIFKRLSDKIGKEKVIWRYDPILTNSTYDVSFHKEMFAMIAEALRDNTERCMLGFIDHYKHIRSAVSQLGIEPLKNDEIEEIAVSFRKTMDLYPAVELDTCTVKIDLRHLGIPAGSCVDKKLIEKIAGYPISAKKDKNQRDVCTCIESIDIGMYESCLNNCIYCYAIKGDYQTAKYSYMKHDQNSPMLIGHPQEDTVIKDRIMRSLRDDQFSLF